MNKPEPADHDINNPLDSVEDILAGQKWAFSRMAPDELMVDVVGKRGTYRMVFMWHEEFSAMQFYCHFDMVVPADRRDLLSLALARVNAGLWLGHFDIPEDTGVPTFRYTALFRGEVSVSDQLQSVMDIALAECDGHHQMFQVLTENEDVNQYEFDLAVMDFAGEA